MMLRRTALSALVAAAIPLTFAAAAQRPVEHRLPESKKNCSLCHTDAGPSLRKKPSELCLDCHQERKPPAEHKVDIVPPMDPGGLPLTDGRITCTTCHDPHRNPFGSLLRRKPTDLCLSCHPV
jgi:predicted CXXCH cytochrome family protein